MKLIYGQNILTSQTRINHGVSNQASVTFLLAQKSHQKRAPTKPTPKYFCRAGSNAARPNILQFAPFLDASRTHSAA
jgi:hypothetical protein